MTHESKKVCTKSPISGLYQMTADIVTVCRSAFHSRDHEDSRTMKLHVAMTRCLPAPQISDLSSFVRFYTQVNGTTVT